MTDARKIIARDVIIEALMQTHYDASDTTRANNVLSALAASGHILTTRAAIDAEIAEARREVLALVERDIIHCQRLLNAQTEVLDVSRENDAYNICRGAIRALAAKGGET